MTVDELIDLVERLVGETTVSDLRAPGAELPSLAELDDKGFALLVRFIGGERPYLPIDSPVAADLDWSPYSKVPVPVPRPERQDPSKPLVLDGKFDGVELP